MLQLRNRRQITQFSAFKRVDVRYSFAATADKASAHRTAREAVRGEACAARRSSEAARCCGGRLCSTCAPPCAGADAKLTCCERRGASPPRDEPMCTLRHS